MGSLALAEFADAAIAQESIKEKLAHLIQQGLQHREYDDYNKIIARQLIPESMVDEWSTRGVLIKSGYMASRNQHGTLLLRLTMPASGLPTHTVWIKIHCERVGGLLSEPTIHTSGSIQVGKDVPVTIGDLRQIVARVANELLGETQ